jgi:ATP-dependent helicase/nuclease subunit A
MIFTAQQKQAIAARGNVLVMAGAGTGKTRTLVERCLQILLEEKPPVSLDEILMVTFTEAAAAEMRQRIRLRLEQELADNPTSPRWHEQLALFDTAHIGTLHSFCFKLVRQHFYELGLDPDLTVLSEAETHLLASETLDEILQKHYAGDDALAEAVQGLIQSQSRGWDKPVRALVLKLHAYAHSLPNPTGWFTEQIKMFESPDPAQWREWLEEALIQWRKNALALLQPLANENELAAKSLAELNSRSAAVPLRASKTGGETPPEPAGEDACATTTALEKILAVSKTCPPRRKTELLGPLEEFFSETKFLCSLTKHKTGDPLAEDWNWGRTNMLALLRLAEEFNLEFTAAKRDLGALDFHDLEQHALRLLWNSESNEPTPIAREWQKKLRFVFVDEYQDINAAQDMIIEALSRKGESANRFLVGDVKQSIYRFRLANPRIFQNYAAAWRKGAGHTIPLTENFRSREEILNFVNSLFELIMRRSAGGIDYDEEARLRFSAPDERRALTTTENSGPCVELHLRLTGMSNGANGHDTETATEIAELEETNKEARLVAMRLRELKVTQYQIWNDEAKAFHAVEWRDMAVLLRSPAAKAEIFAKEFAALGVPLVVARGGFFSSMEILDLLSLLQLLDNPLQDVPAIAVLRSPMVGLTLDELATIRLSAMKMPFWTALIRSQKSEVRTQKVEQFLERFSRWRKLARQNSLSRCLEAVLAETHYLEWLLTQSRGEQRRANVQRLLHLARQFDQFQRQGLFRFLRFVEAQQDEEVEPEVAADAEQNAVRLMSIHQSKGLEFPIVVVADLSKRFNESDLRADVILDETYGLCPQIKPPQTGARYPSLPHWLARRRQKREMLGEELRLLYVAATRAQDTLILTASISEKNFESQWNTPMAIDENKLLDVGSFADWVAMWFANNCAGEQFSSGKNSPIHWQVWGDTQLVTAKETIRDQSSSADEFGTDEHVWNELERRLRWEYPFTAATERAAKVSVTTLRREAMDVEAEGESESLFKSKVQSPKSKVRRKLINAATAADLGTVHHKFLHFVSLNQTGSAAELKSETARMEQQKILTREEIALLDVIALASFWVSALGNKIREHSKFVRRELEFTARFSILELTEITGKPAKAADEFVIVQGIADLVVILENEIWLLDFKTDQVEESDLPSKVKLYAPQLKLYAKALSRIYRKPVSAAWLHFLSIGETVKVETNKITWPIGAADFPERNPA